MDHNSQPTRLDVDRVRQIIGVTASDHAYRDRREALAMRTLGCIQGYAQLRDDAHAMRMVRAALRAERELAAVGTPEYDTIMEELEPVHTGIGDLCTMSCTPVDHRC